MYFTGYYLDRTGRNLEIQVGSLLAVLEFLTRENSRENSIHYIKVASNWIEMDEH